MSSSSSGGKSCRCRGRFHQPPPQTTPQRRRRRRSVSSRGRPCEAKAHHQHFFFFKFCCVFLAWCLVFLFITRERREREFHTTRLPEDKKDEECVSKTCRTAMIQILSSFPFLSVSNPKFFITSLHTYHTHCYEHAAHVDISIINLRDS